VAALVVAGLTAIGAIAGFFVETSDERLSSALDPLTKLRERRSFRSLAVV
jgi:hypothetical protein